MSGKHNASHWKLLVTVMVLLPVAEAAVSNEIFTDEFIVQVKTEYWPDVHDQLVRRGAQFIKEVIPQFYLFKDGHLRKDLFTNNMLIEDKLLHINVESFERVRGFIFDADRRLAAAAASSGKREHYIQNCPTFSDMGVEEVWEMGYTGKNVVIAINDAGIDIDIPDLKDNIIQELSHNVIDNTNDVTPDRCSVSDLYNHVSDHGNNCAGIVGAAKNNLCGDGVAHEAGLAAFKVFKLTQNQTYEKCNIHVETPWIAQGLIHSIQNVDVYLNSYGAFDNFLEGSEIWTRALQLGVKKGRNGKGSIYVFPVGPLADPFANNVHTIAVNSVNGSNLPSSFSHVCACTLTSTFGEPMTKGRYFMHTASHLRGYCTADFKGTSASAAIVSGVIGLVLQSRPDLSWRDIQDLIVKASDWGSLANHEQFQANGAGHRYDTVLGFGLLNATKMVRLAEKAKSLPEQLTITVKTAKYLRGTTQQYVFFDACTLEVSCSETCINQTESVLLKVTYWTQQEQNFELILTSPSKTDSLLMDTMQSSHTTRKTRKDVTFKSVTFWGEATEGAWTAYLNRRIGQGEFKIERCELTIFGTGFIQPLQPLRNTTRPAATKLPGQNGHGFTVTQTHELPGASTSAPYDHTLKEDLNDTWVNDLILVVFVVYLPLMLLQCLPHLWPWR